MASNLGKAALFGAPILALGTGYLVQRRCKKDGESCLGTAALTGVSAVVATGVLAGLILFGPTLYRMATTPQTERGRW